MKAVIGALAALALGGAAMTASGAAAPDGKQVSGQGCVKPGVETSCLILQDTTSGKLYNLLIKGPKPAVGTGIDFTGVTAGGGNTCMQGLAVQVSKWTPNAGLKCSKGRSGLSVQ